jgi:hypothetical protein
VISRGFSVRQLPVAPLPLSDELLSSWLARTSSYYGTTTKDLPEQIGCIETSLEILDRTGEPADSVALAFALRAEPAALLDISFNGLPEPMLNFISPWARLRECPRCSVEFRVRGTIAVLRQWCVAFAVSCQRCGQPLAACQWSYRWAEDDTAAVERRSARLCAALEFGLRDVGKAMALARVMAALATPLPVASRGRSHRADRPLLWCSAFYRREAESKTRAADPSRPFARWRVPAQLAAICLLEEVVCDDHARGQIADRELVDRGDRNVIRDLLGLFDRAAEPRSRAPVAPDKLLNWCLASFRRSMSSCARAEPGFQGLLPLN